MTAPCYWCGGRAATECEGPQAKTFEQKSNPVWQHFTEPTPGKPGAISAMDW